MRTDEGIAIVNMGVSAMIAVLFLGLLALIFRYNYAIQQSFEREQLSSEQAQNYAKSSAYDDTEINGQDVLTFIMMYRGEIPVALIPAINGDYTAAVSTGTMSASSSLAFVDDAQVYVTNAQSVNYPVYVTTYEGVIKDSLMEKYVPANLANTVLYEPNTTGWAADDNERAKEILLQKQDLIKKFRQTVLSKSDGKFGTWHSVVLYRDRSCTTPGMLVCWPVE